ncbi:MAG: peptidoglycan editing factor PgeF [Proteobacteria bacterium]|nr:peptidoglycan editing factor PgeF [Pseudomonadota bacterium]
MTIKYHFFGKECLIARDLADHSNLERKLCEKNISFDAILFVNQIHSAAVVTIDSVEKIHGNEILPRADGLVTNLSNIVLAIFTADCAPILFLDAEKKIIAATHAGWLGAKSGVISSTISAMKKLGAENIEAIVGPMIQQESYEVSQEFFDDFLNEDLANKSFFVEAGSAEKHYFNLPAYVEKKLRESGITKITNQRTDTYKNEEDFFSFRRSTHRSEIDCGRNISIITIN